MGSGSRGRPQKEWVETMASGGWSTRHVAAAWPVPRSGTREIDAGNRAVLSVDRRGALWWTAAGL